MVLLWTVVCPLQVDRNKHRPLCRPVRVSIFESTIVVVNQCRSENHRIGQVSIAINSSFVVWTGSTVNYCSPYQPQVQRREYVLCLGTVHLLTIQISVPVYDGQPGVRHSGRGFDFSEADFASLTRWPHFPKSEVPTDAAVAVRYTANTYKSTGQGTDYVNLSTNILFVVVLGLFDEQDLVNDN